MGKRPAWVLAGLLLVALAARLGWLSDRLNVNEPDEIMYLGIAENFARGCLYPRYDYSPYRDGLLLVPPMPLYAAGLVFKLAGPSLVAFRAMNAAVGVASVAAFDALCGLYLGAAPRVVATLLFALSPVALYESTQAMLGAPAVLFLILSLRAYVRFSREGRGRDLVLFAVGLGAAAACKQYGILLGGLVAAHWCWRRVAEGGPPLRRLLAAFAIALGTFCVLAPWVLWRPYDSLHCYLYRSLILHVVTFLRGQHGGGSLFSLPYPELVLAHGLVGVVGLAAFLGTWRRKRDVASFYGLLLALPIIVSQEVRYLSLALPAACLFEGYLLAAGPELARGRLRAVRGASVALGVLLVGSLLPMLALPWRAPSGLEDACRYVAENTMPHEQVMANYWRPVVERYTRRKMPRDWLDEEARRRIERREVSYVVLDDSEYTRRVLHTPERARLAAWVRRSFPLARSFSGGGQGGTQVFLTRATGRGS